MFPRVLPVSVTPSLARQRLFSGGKLTEVSVRRADCHGDLFSSQTLGELKFLDRDRRCFSGRGRVDRMDWRTNASPRISEVFFSSYKLPKTVTVTTLLLFGHVMLLCGKFLCIKCMY